MSKLLTVDSIRDGSGNPREFDNPHGWTSDQADTLHWIMVKKCSCAHNIVMMGMAAAINRSQPSSYIRNETSKRIFNNSIKGSDASE